MPVIPAPTSPVKLKIEWEHFVVLAMACLEEKYGPLAEPKFMRLNGYEPDGECYDIPVYVEIEVKDVVRPSSKNPGDKG